VRDVTGVLVPSIPAAALVGLEVVECRVNTLKRQSIFVVVNVDGGRGGNDSVDGMVGACEVLLVIDLSDGPWFEGDAIASISRRLPALSLFFLFVPDLTLVRRDRVCCFYSLIIIHSLVGRCDDDLRGPAVYEIFPTHNKKIAKIMKNIDGLYFDNQSRQYGNHLERIGFQS
jgi:hypothetical protein